MAAGGSRPVAERLLTRRATLTVQVRDVAAAAGQIDGIAEQAEGIVSESSRTDDRAWFTLHVTAARLESVLDQLAHLGPLGYVLHGLWWGLGRLFVWP
jgi:hypothetical protein